MRIRTLPDGTIRTLPDGDIRITLDWLIAVRAIIQQTTQELNTFQSNYAPVTTARILLPKTQDDVTRTMHEVLFDNSDLGAIAAQVTHVVENGQRLITADHEYQIDQVRDRTRDTAFVILR